MSRDIESIFVSNGAGRNKLSQADLERAHTFLLIGGHDVQKLIRAAFPDEVPHRISGNEHLEGCDHSATDLRDKPLGQNGAERCCKLNSGLLLAPCREDVDDAVDRLWSVIGVKGGKDKVTSLGHGEGNLNGLDVTHFAHKQNVRVLPES